MCRERVFGVLSGNFAATVCDFTTLLATLGSIEKKLLARPNNLFIIGKFYACFSWFGPIHEGRSLRPINMINHGSYKNLRTYRPNGLV